MLGTTILLGNGGPISTSIQCADRVGNVTVRDRSLKGRKVVAAGTRLDSQDSPRS